MRLEGKTAIVTGGGGEIGRAIALGLAREGARVAIADINLAAAAETAREIEAGGGQALALSCDVSDAGQVERMVSEVVGHFGGVDILINGAGIQFRAPVAEASEEHWDQTMAVNLKGPFLCSRAVLRHMIPRRTGTILNLASGLGLLGLATASAYAASKAGLINFTRSLAQEVVSYNITVNAVAPGRTDTPLF
ncbi:MAG TPA: SDR family NAD(P)-dependent oxidoreductase, partial [Dehalococcoidia bacterium]|nr:SDR family NAD(P)-dependent oxidoreductase [Dehalococcoidia bacterium]